MSVVSTITYTDGLSFDVEVNGHHFDIDADAKYGGKDRGPKPMPLLLSALGGCSGMDTVSILRKMKFADFKLKVEVEGEYSTGDHPHIYESIEARYYFEGEGLVEDKVKHAIKLSMTQYCGVKAMLDKAADITWKIFINGREVS
ncbi:MAG: OsmC family protein [Candidatus Cloacimonetes bacterium]|nr:OsmC family protein [Candidatus Cloacimonadota bacterium]